MSLVVQNRGERRVRVDAVRVSYGGDAGPADGIFAAAGLPLPLEVEAGTRETWTGLCLSPPSGAATARLDFSLSVRKGLRRERREESLQIPLRATGPPLVLDLPVTGAWRVTQGHDCSTQHRRGRLGGEFAWDFAAVNEEGRSGTPRYGTTHRNADSATFGREIVAPVSGTVLSVVDGVADNDEQQDFPRRSIVETARAPRWIFGNYLVLDAGGERFVLLAHLMRGSITVRVGDKVEAGRPIARAGNSGNTMLPHLHVQVMDRADPADPAVAGLPAAFRDYVEITARGTATIRDASVRRVGVGDPPQDAIVMRPDGR